MLVKIWKEDGSTSRKKRLRIIQKITIEVIKRICRKDNSVSATLFMPKNIWEENQITEH